LNEKKVLKMEDLTESVEQVRSGAAVPGGTKDARQKIEKLQSALPMLNPDHAMTAAENLLELLKDSVDAKEALEIQQKELARLQDRIELQQRQIGESVNSIASLYADLQKIIDILRRTKDRELQTLDKLDRYLDAWT